ncbi:type II toxin-antitoxin system ParD family antitoxin [[Limnothrix rosea] IAM M-220]
MTPEQENFIQAKLQTGKYKSAQEVVAIALHLMKLKDLCEAQSHEE